MQVAASSSSLPSSLLLPVHRFFSGFLSFLSDCLPLFVLVHWLMCESFSSPAVCKSWCLSFSAALLKLYAILTAHPPSVSLPSWVSDVQVSVSALCHQCSHVCLEFCSYWAHIHTTSTDAYRINQLFLKPKFLYGLYGSSKLKRMEKKLNNRERMREMPPVFPEDLRDFGWLPMSSIYIGLGPQAGLCWGSGTEAHVPAAELLFAS